MRLFTLAVVAAALCSGAAAKDPKPRVGKPAPAEATTLAQRSVSLPVNIAGGPAGQSQCVFSAGPAVPVSALAFHPNGKLLVTGGYQEVLVWDLGTARLERRLGAKLLRGQVRALAFMKGAGALAVADGSPGQSGNVSVINFETGEPLASFEPAKDEIFALALSPDRRFLAAGGADSLVRVWSLEDRKLVATLKEHSDWIQGLAFSPDGKWLASASADKTSQVWKSGTWKPVVNLPATVTDQARGVAFSPEGDLMAFAVGGDDERGVRIWRTESAEEPNETDAARARRKAQLKVARPFSTGAGLPLGVAFASSTQYRNSRVRLVLPCADKTIRVLASTGGYIATLSGHTDWVYGVAVSADGTRIASGSADGTVKVWNAVDNTLLATLVQLAPRGDSYVMVTPRGFFAGSSGAAMQWKTADPKIQNDELAKRLRNPDAVRDILAGRPPAPATRGSR